MEIEIQDIRGGKRRGGKGTDKQLVDGAIALDANSGRRRRGVMRGDHQPHLRSS